MKGLKSVWMWGASFVVGLYTTFAMLMLWNWFAVKALNAPEISYFTMYGLNLLIRMLFDRSDGDVADNFRWERTMIMLRACLPVEKREESEQKLKEEDELMTVIVGSTVFGQFVANTITLAIGWGVSTFLV